ncbi:uncharacterized protein LOC130050763 [Ostrea edulis]|uniref:uncharacterized protein LOC130050763 n=1 Tax=Ostrea edulis TaxID=37623 RepID=UPI0024AF33B7|nr:uncharacterized protein LOC130050763 [Ostrea edulis]XP_056007195.1 uncharacterized protein LOC130050763 [Ostrea edulis]
MLRCKEGRKDETDSQKKNAIKQSLDKIKEAHEELGIRLFFNPRDFENRLYNKEEVLGILSYFGHSAVARKAEKRYPEVKPSTVNVTGRTFKKFSFKPIGDTCDPNIHEEMDTEEMRIPIEAGRGQLERASLEDVDHEEAGIEKEEDTATSRQDTELNTPTVQEDIEDNDRAVGTGRGQLERASLEDVDHEEAGIEKEEGTATSRREYGIVSGVTQEDVTEDEDIKVPLGRQEVLTEYLCHSKETRDNVCRHKDPRVTVKTENVGLMWNAYSQNVQIATDVTSSAQLALQEADTAAVHTPKKRKIDPASPKAPPSAGKSRVTKALIDKYGSIADAEIPAPSELVLYGIKKDKRVQVSRALRYEREVTIYKEAASYLLNRLTKSTGKRVENITEVPWDQPEVPHSVSRGRVLKDNLLRRYMGLILADDKARKAARTDDDVVA